MRAADRAIIRSGHSGSTVPRAAGVASEGWKLLNDALSDSGGQRPYASPLARWQARSQEDVTSMAYTTVRMEEAAARLLLTLLDGTRDREAIRAEFREQTGVPISPEDLDANLDALAKLFLLSES